MSVEHFYIGALRSGEPFTSLAATLYGASRWKGLPVLVWPRPFDRDLEDEAFCAIVQRFVRLNERNNFYRALYRSEAAWSAAMTRNGQHRSTHCPCCETLVPSYGDASTLIFTCLRAKPAAADPPSRGRVRELDHDNKGD